MNAALMDSENHDLSNVNQDDDSEVESWKIELDKNRTPIAILIMALIGLRTNMWRRDRKRS